MLRPRKASVKSCVTPLNRPLQPQEWGSTKACLRGWLDVPANGKDTPGGYHRMPRHASPRRGGESDDARPETSSRRRKRRKTPDEGVDRSDRASRHRGIPTFDRSLPVKAFMPTFSTDSKEGDSKNAFYSDHQWPRCRVPDPRRDGGHHQRRPRVLFGHGRGIRRGLGHRQRPGPLPLLRQRRGRRTQRLRPHAR